MQSTAWAKERSSTDLRKNTIPCKTRPATGPDSKCRCQNMLSSSAFLGCVMPVGQAIVQGDEGPVSGVAQGVEDHGVAGVRHENEKEEGEVEQEIEGEKEENNTQGRRHMCM